MGRLAVAIAALGLLPAVPLLAGSGLLNTRGGGDSPFLVFRLVELWSNLQAGVFPVRWMPDAAFGLGYPFFNYYASLPLYAAALFKLWGLSMIASLKVTQALGFVAAGLAMVLWARKLFRHPAAILLSAVAYTLAPFHLVNVYVRGDSLSEFYAFVFYPLILWAVHETVERPSTGRIAALALAYSGLLLCHNISALIFTPFVIFYSLLLVVDRVEMRKQGAPRHFTLRVGILALGGLLGLALAAWFWVPALGEASFGQLAPVTTGYFHFNNHFRSLNLIQPGILFDYTGQGDATGPTPFAMGLVQAALTVLGLGVLSIQAVRGVRPTRPMLFAIAGLVLSTFMITPLSDPVWANIPLLPLVQFPWRFLSIQAVFAAVLTGQIADTLAWRKGPNLAFASPLWIVGWPVALALSTLLLVAGLAELRPAFLPLSESDLTAERLQLYEYFTGNIGTTIRYEYLPRWTNPRPYTSQSFLTGKSPQIHALTGSAEGTPGALGPTWQVWNLSVSDTSARVAFPLLYWPGWSATVDGQAAAIQPVDGPGWSAIDVPGGTHRVELRLEPTPLRTLAEAISLVGLVGIAALLAVFVRQYLMQRRPKRRSILRSPIFFAGLFLILILIGAIAWRIWPESDLSGPETMDFAEAPYLHPNPGGLLFQGEPGTERRMVSYRLSAETVRRGETLEVDMNWVGNWPTGAQVHLTLVSSAQILFGAPYTVARSDASLFDGHTHHRIEIPLQIPPGVYLLSLSVDHPGGSIPARSLSGSDLQEVFLQPVRISPDPIPIPPGPIQAVEADQAEPLPSSLASAASPPLGITGFRTAQIAPGQLQIELTWLPSVPITANLSVSWRLLDHTGQTQNQYDKEITYGLYPTSLWHPKEPVPDRYVIPLRPAIPPGSDYRMVAIVYDSRTMQVWGQTEWSGIALH